MISFDTYTLDELQILKKALRNKIKTVKYEKQATQIKKEVKNKGYACVLKPIDPNKVCDTNIYSMTFPYYINVYTYDKEDTHFLSVCSKQNDWVTVLHFNEDVSKYPYSIISDEEEDWDYQDHDDPAIGRAQIIIQVFYQKRPPPQEGEHFECFNEEGETEKWQIKDGKIYSHRYMSSDGTIDEWDDLGLFVVP